MTRFFSLAMFYKIAEDIKGNNFVEHSNTKKSRPDTENLFSVDKSFSNGLCSVCRRPTSKPNLHVANRTPESAYSPLGDPLHHVSINTQIAVDVVDEDDPQPSVSRCQSLDESMDQDTASTSSSRCEYPIPWLEALFLPEFPNRSLLGEQHFLIWDMKIVQIPVSDARRTWKRGFRSRFQSCDQAR